MPRRSTLDRDFCLDDDDFRGERFVDRTLVRDLPQSCVLLFGEWPSDTDGALDPVNEAVFVLKTLFTIF